MQTHISISELETKNFANCGGYFLFYPFILGIFKNAKRERKKAANPLNRFPAFWFPGEAAVIQL